MRTNRRIYEGESSPAPHQPMATDGSPYYGDITVIENHIYLYQAITPKSIMDMGIAIRSVGQQIVNLMTDLSLPSVPPIHLHINSPGGCVFSGLAGASHVLESKCLSSLMWKVLRVSLLQYYLVSVLAGI